MALKIAKNSGLTDIVSAGDNSNPITTLHSINGTTQTVQLWLFNDDNTKYYTGISIDPIDSTGSDESTWVYLSTDNVTYQAAGAALNMANIGAQGSADTTGKTFYMKVISPSGQTVQNKTDIKLSVAYTEFAV
jgi:hypothetical protein